MSGLILGCNPCEFVGGGYYSNVFFTNTMKSVVKVFKKDSQNVKIAFEGEIAAYELAMASTNLAQFVPKFFGVVEVDDILNTQNQSEKYLYMLPYAYHMEYVPGKFSLNKGLNGYENSLFIKSLFNEVGIFGLDDVSVVVQNNKIIKVIDFSVCNNEIFHPEN